MTTYFAFFSYLLMILWIVPSHQIYRGSLTSILSPTEKDFTLLFHYFHNFANYETFCFYSSPCSDSLFSWNPHIQLDRFQKGISRSKSRIKDIFRTYVFSAWPCIEGISIPWLWKLNDVFLWILLYGIEKEIFRNADFTESVTAMSCSGCYDVLQTYRTYEIVILVLDFCQSWDRNLNVIAAILDLFFVIFFVVFQNWRIL